MKKLLILLFSLFFLYSPSVFADDISDFEIDGISIGDSLLDYMTKEEILKEIERSKDWYLYLKEPNKYSYVFLSRGFPIYVDGISVFIKNNSSNQYVTDKNEKFTILALRGLIFYIEDFDSCIQKRDEIVEILSEMFPNTQKTEDIFPPPYDPLGITHDTYFSFDEEDNIRVRCNNFDENYRIKENVGEGLSVGIYSKDVMKWMRDYK